MWTNYGFIINFLPAILAKHKRASEEAAASAPAPSAPQPAAAAPTDAMPMPEPLPFAEDEEIPFN